MRKHHGFSDVFGHNGLVIQRLCKQDRKPALAFLLGHRQGPVSTLPDVPRAELRGRLSDRRGRRVHLSDAVHEGFVISCAN